MNITNVKDNVFYHLVEYSIECGGLSHRIPISSRIAGLEVCSAIDNSQPDPMGEDGFVNVSQELDLGEDVNFAYIEHRATNKF